MKDRNIVIPPRIKDFKELDSFMNELKKIKEPATKRTDWVYPISMIIRRNSKLDKTLTEFIGQEWRNTKDPWGGEFVTFRGTRIIFKNFITYCLLYFYNLIQF